MSKPTNARKTATKKGLDLISAAHQRKFQKQPPDLKRELKRLRKPEDVGDLVAIYDCYMAAAEAILGITNQPRAAGIDFIDQEWNWLVRRAWETAEHMKRLRPTQHAQEGFVRTLFGCALDMGNNIDEAVSVLEAAMAVGAVEEKQGKAA
jgi:hypothetical protein